MAIRGVKPKPIEYLKLIGANTEGKAPDPAVTVESTYDNGLEPPRKIAGRQLQLWNQFVRKAPWLTEFDAPRAYMWVFLHTEFERKPTKMVAGRLAQLRALGSELGLDPTSRARLGGEAAKAKPKTVDIAETFFDGT